MKPEELLDKVCDAQSFIAFVEALASERAEAERIERAEPLHRVDGALDWKNAKISEYLSACLSHFVFHEPKEEPTWREFAEFLYSGKIIE
ncbi:MAG: hypothetical protein ACE15C_09125 [Phycisphaerae bacterium]